MDFTPVAGDTAGNNLKWDSMTIEADMYLKTGNYSLLRDVRMRQARFTELEGNERIAISYYCMAFYADLNGFENLDRLIAARDSSFSDWKCTAHVDVGIFKTAIRNTDCMSDDFLLAFLTDVLVILQCIESSTEPQHSLFVL